MASAGRLTALVQGRSSDAVMQVSAALSPAVGKISNLIADHASGSWVWTTDGRKLLDFGCGIGTLSTGHCHPRVVQAITEQAHKLVQGQQNQFLSSTAQVGLLDRLGRIAPEGLSSFFFASSGSEVVDNAVKLVRAATKRPNIICFEGGFHGRTMGAMALTTSKTIYREGFAPLMPGVITAPYPYCLHCPTRLAAPDGAGWYKLPPNIPPFEHYQKRRCCGSPMDSLRQIFKMQSAPEETAAIIVEPILGEGGFITPPPGFLSTIRELCDEHGILMIMDEVQAGVGRTGKWWGHQHFEDLVPDIMLFAKGIGSGYPFAGIAAKPHLYAGMKPGSMGGTYGGNALGCAVASAVIDVIEDEQLLLNATNRGSQIAQGLVPLLEKYPIVDIRGRGLMSAIEFGGRDGSLNPEYGTAGKVVKACGDRGLLILSAGARESIRFLPALNVKEDEVTQALDILDKALADVFHS